ncbi:unnamed protein product [Pedinophyceae sp. YPF-701]|nr:unnamed protein product [Pedinophyceae sp. YPF-701]
MSRATALALVESLHPHVNPIQNGLRVLDLSWCSGCLSDAAGPTLLSGLAAHPRLEELRLTKTGIAADAAQELGVMVACLPGLRVLELSWNDIGDDGAAAVARAAGSAPRRERGAERELRELLLYSCGITDVGAAALTEHLRSGASRGGARLEALDVSFNSIGKGAVAALLAAVEEGGRLRTFASEGAVEECGTCGTKDCGSCAPLLGDW